MSDLPKLLVIGEILRPHGVRGELRMRVLTDNRELIPQLESVRLGDSADEATSESRALRKARFNKDYALLSLEGCDSRDAADELRGKLVMIGIEQTAPLQDGEYYLFQLIGMTVVADGEEIGRLKEVLQTGANDVYILESERFGELLLPAHDETIRHIDFEARVIRMALPDGLLPSSQS